METALELHLNSILSVLSSNFQAPGHRGTVKTLKEKHDSLHAWLQQLEHGQRTQLFLPRVFPFHRGQVATHLGLSSQALSEASSQMHQGMPGLYWSGDTEKDTWARQVLKEKSMVTQEELHLLLLEAEWYW